MSAGQFSISSNPEAQLVMEGFKLNWMNMRDASTGVMMWESPGDWTEKFFLEELEARVPATILECKEVSREVNFTSLQKIDNFKLLQRVFLQDQVIEEWRFNFGFVIPGSTNTWQSVIEAAGDMLPAELLSGNVTIETSFIDGDATLGKSLVRVFYD
eukprot:CAMPEP_0114560124 /NCGR_PEP_ID=MMETSP0114-20121206/11292_1 /TAXON_ID=31324 /ORGANISM="Goniomonas sp, Strain m" /LENGTH=156 /DNA_ID=CAMNT_0001745649 /DNA_START=32 /DNA_END=502 /DNA_ORIENTATION=+